MKRTLLASLLFSFSALAEVKLPVQNYPYISDWFFKEEVEQSKKYVVMVFSSSECLERPTVERSCFLFEKRFDYFVPKFSKNVKVVGFNTYFENFEVVNNLYVNKIPSVLIMKGGKLIKRIEPDFLPLDVRTGSSWQDRFLKDSIKTIQKIY